MFLSLKCYEHNKTNECYWWLLCILFLSFDIFRRASYASNRDKFIHKALRSVNVMLLTNFSLQILLINDLFYGTG